jgi:beta-lactamase class A
MIGKSAMSEKTIPFLQSLEQKITQSGAAEVSLAALDLQSDEEFLLRPDLSFHPASTFKLCVMLEAYHQAQQGKISLEDLLPVKNEFQSIVDGSLFSLDLKDDSETGLYDHLGGRLPVRDLIRRMITRSSNLATNLLIALLTPQAVTAFMHQLGANDLLVRRGVEDNKAYALGLNNTATARSLMQVLVRLARLEAVSPAASDEMLSILKQQYFNEGIPAGLPAEVVVAHKTGWNEKLYHDTAILFPPGREPYVLVIMTRALAEDKEAPALVATISRLVFDQLTA